MEADVSVSSTLAADDILTSAKALSFLILQDNVEESPVTSKLDF